MSDSSPDTPEITYVAVVGRVIEYQREAVRLRQEQLAETLGITQSAYSRLEKGHSAMTLTQLRQVALRLGMSPSVIVQKADGFAAQLSSRGVVILNERQRPEDPRALTAFRLMSVLLAARR